MIRIPSPAGVTDEVAARFREDGYLVVDRLVDGDAVDQIRSAYDEIIEGRVAAPGTRTDLDDVQIWLALDPVDVDNGCMQFVPREQGAPSLAHRVASGDADDEGRLIELDEPIDTADAVACPLQPGGCTVHLVGTPHYTGPNLTDRPRRAYIFNIGPRAMAEASEQALASTWGDSARL